jgi:hypothetical protein
LRSPRPAAFHDNVGALTLALDDDTIAELDAAFPMPCGPTPFEML